MRNDGFRHEQRRAGIEQGSQSVAWGVASLDR
jgi:hypothetical protein